MTFQHCTIKNDNGQEDYNHNRYSSSERQGGTRERVLDHDEGEEQQDQQEEARGVVVTPPLILTDVFTHHWGHNHQEGEPNHLVFPPNLHSFRRATYDQQRRTSNERVFEIVEEALLIAESPFDDDSSDDIDVPVVSTSATTFGGRLPPKGRNDTNFQQQ